MHIYEYIWMGGDNEFRGKSKVLDKVLTLEELPKWDYDGSSTKQADGNDSEVMLHPVKLIKDPLTNDSDFIVLCETRKPDGTPLNNNFRPTAKEIFDKHLQEKPWFGLEQEFFLFNPLSGYPVGFTNDGKSRPQGPFYCGVGSGNSNGREVMYQHLKACIKAGLTISGINAEVAPGQWEFQIGPVEGIDAADQLLLARYLLERICENYTLLVNYQPKLIKGDWNGSGCHINFSTTNMREGTEDKTGLEYIEEAIKNMAVNHIEDMKVYGEGNDKRLTGNNETSSYDTFTHGKANRGASVRIGNKTYKNKKGYFEDRRPASNINPYQAISALLKTVMV